VEKIINHKFKTGFFVHNIIISALKRVEFASDKMSYITLFGCWSDIVALNMHAPNKEKYVIKKTAFTKN
jgi:hypothetical protein